MAGDNLAGTPGTDKLDATAAQEDNNTVGRLLLDAGTTGLTTSACYAAITILAPESAGLSLLAIPVCVAVGWKAGDIAADAAYGPLTKKK